MKTKTFLLDSMLNIISAALPILVLQIFALPLIASELGGKEYGIIVALISLLTVISFPIGNVLNNVRLLMNENYKTINTYGDFNPFLVGTSLLGVVTIITTSVYVDSSLDIISLVLLSLITVFSLWKEYLIVSFRLVLDFKGILLNNIYLSLGYSFGTLLFFLIGHWQIIYLAGLIFSLIHISLNSNLHKEPYKFTSLFKKTMSKSIMLYISSLLKNLINYADKLILLPLLGPTSVAVYYTATILGKIISMMINPINSVILSYLVKMEKVSIKSFSKMLGLALVVGGIGYTITIFISPFFFNTFYNEWADQSLQLIYITTATAVIGMLSTIIHPFNLRFNKTSWQVYMSALHLLVYVIASYYFFTSHGLIGFSFGILISSIFKLCLQLIIFLLSYKYINRTE